MRAGKQQIDQRQVRSAVINFKKVKKKSPL